VILELSNRLVDAHVETGVEVPVAAGGDERLMVLDVGDDLYGIAIPGFVDDDRLGSSACACC
jgi:hypothetical protein